MGLRGPQAKPYGMRVIEGSANLAAMRVPEPAGEADMPDWLTEGAQQEWERIVSSYAPGHFKLADSGMLAAYCQAVDDFACLTRTIASQGMICEGKSHPAFVARSKACSQIASLGTKLGIGPATRSAGLNPTASSKRKARGLL